MTNKALFLVLRRMRLPLLVLIAIYAVAVLGLVLMPGLDAQGRPHSLTFFHAFYVITYTATTTGFGELPHPFTDAQRLWVTFSMYVSIVAWLYAIGALIALVRDPALKQVIGESRFAAAVRRMSEPFFLVCGYGDTGAVVLHALAHRGHRAVVIDIRQERINDLTLEDLPGYVPALAADAALPAILLTAGLRHPSCAGVIALCGSDQVNLKIAISCKLLAPRIKVVCRAQTHEIEANMESFGTDVAINPFDSFAERLALALHSPDMHLLYEWLTSMPGTLLAERIDPPRGRWVLCGYGRFGKAVSRYLQFEGVQTTIVEYDPERTEAPEDVVVGRGTEAVTLREAHIDKAVGIVAGTDDDANNLSIVMTAKALNPQLFTVARQNLRENDAIFEAARVDLTMQRSRAVARRILATVSTPMLTEFLRLARRKNNDWARTLIERLRPVIGSVVPEMWCVELSDDEAPALCAALKSGEPVRMEHLLADARDREQRLDALPLLHLRGDEEELLPAAELALSAGDRILFCGRRRVENRQRWLLCDEGNMHYVLHGEVSPQGALWRWLHARRSPRAG